MNGASFHTLEKFFKPTNAKSSYVHNEMIEKPAHETADSAELVTMSFEDFVQMEEKGETQRKKKKGVVIHSGKRTKRKRQSEENLAATKKAKCSSQSRCENYKSTGSEDNCIVLDTTHDGEESDITGVCKIKSSDSDHDDTKSSSCIKRKVRKKVKERMQTAPLSKNKAIDRKSSVKISSSTKQCKLGCDVGKPLRNGKNKTRKSSSDGVVYVADVKKATHPHLIPKACRSPMKLKKSVTDLPPLQHDCVLWTEKHKPESSKDLVGNTSAIGKLCAWLREWKKKVTEEKEQLMKQARPRANEGMDDDSSSDFEECGNGAGGEDDEWINDENSLITTGVIIGPTGSGKTAAVYTCAKELGFKVFEMNASSNRSSKQVLAQLQEATQSHLVSKKKKENAAPFFFGKTDQKKMKKSPLSKKSLLPILSKKRQSSSAKDIENDAKKKEKISLILFEEVEVLFEEDKFFWSAVQTFMAETKRPIIIVTTQSSVLNNLERKYEKFVFKLPTPELLASCLANIGQAEGCFSKSVEHSGLVLAAKAMRCDIRRSINSIHFWGSDAASLSAAKNDSKKNMVMASQQSGGARPKRTSMRQRNRDAEDSTTQDICQGAQFSGTHGCSNVITGGVASVKDLFSKMTGVYGLVGHNTNMEKVKCMRNVESMQRGVLSLFDLESLKTHPKCVELLETALAHMYFSNLPQLILLNWQTFLHQPKTESLKSSVVGTTRLPIHVSSSFFGQNIDMDFSVGPFQNDYLSMVEGFGEAVQQVPHELLIDEDSMDVNYAFAKNLKDYAMGTKPATNPSRHGGEELRKTNSELISELSLMADFCALSDCLHYSFKNSSASVLDDDVDHTVCRVTYGLSDTYNLQSELSYKSLSAITDLEASFQSRALVFCANQLKNVPGNEVDASMQDLHLNLPHEGKPRRCNRYLRQSMQASLVGGLLTHRKNFVLDYLPSLRSICRSEERRKEAKVKRRFLHYLNNVNLHAKPSEMHRLKCDFEERPVRE